MLRLLVHWVLSALAILAVAHYVQGFYVGSFVVALIAAVVIGLINGTLGLFVKVVTFPLTIFTLGIFLLVVNAVMLKLVAAFLPGFRIEGFMPAFWGALLLAILNMIIRALTKAPKESDLGFVEA
jgi:putative membrane protein